MKGPMTERICSENYAKLKGTCERCPLYRACILDAPVGIMSYEKLDKFDAERESAAADILNKEKHDGQS